MREETLVTNIIRHQRILEGMITALVGNATVAQDLFQEVAVVMTRKREDVPDDARFVAWGRSIALNVIRDHRKSQARKPIQFLDDASLDSVAAEFEKEGGRWEERRHALKGCTEELEERDRKVMELRYSHGESVLTVASTLSMSRGALDTLLYRIRKNLLLCVEGRLREEGSR